MSAISTKGLMEQLHFIDYTDFEQIPQSPDLKGDLVPPHGAGEKRPCTWLRLARCPSSQEPPTDVALQNPRLWGTHEERRSQRYTDSRLLRDLKIKNRTLDLIWYSIGTTLAE